MTDPTIKNNIQWPNLVVSDMFCNIFIIGNWSITSEQFFYHTHKRNMFEICNIKYFTVAMYYFMVAFIIYIYIHLYVLLIYNIKFLLVVALISMENQETALPSPLSQRRGPGCSTPHRGIG